MHSMCATESFFFCCASIMELNSDHPMTAQRYEDSRPVFEVPQLLDLLQLPKPSPFPGVGIPVQFRL